VVASVKGYGSTPLTGDVSHDPSREAGGRTNLSQRNCDGAQANLSQIIRQNLLLNVLRRSFGYCYGDISSEVNVNVRVSSRRSQSEENSSLHPTDQHSRQHTQKPSQGIVVTPTSFAYVPSIRATSPVFSYVPSPQVLSSISFIPQNHTWARHKPHKVVAVVRHLNCPVEEFGVSLTVRHFAPPAKESITK
jgi:hypothetical protein